MKDTTEKHKEVSNGLAWSGFELQFSKSTKILDFWKYVKLKEKFHLNLSFGSESHTKYGGLLLLIQTNQVCKWKQLSTFKHKWKF